MAIHDRSSIDTNSSIESFHSAIPRPISGTSRREIPANRFKLSKVIPSLSSEQARRPLREVSQILQDEQQRENSHSKIYLPPLEIPSSVFGAEAQTSPDLLSPGKEIKAHALLKPLDPPLPRSKTYNDVSSLEGLPKVKKHPSPVSIQLSANDEINRKRIELQQERGKGSATIFLNTTIPKMHAQNAKAINESKAGEHDDPRYVWGEEPTEYWTGRYMALLDNIRTGELRSSMQTGLNKNGTRKKSPSHVRAAKTFDQNQQQLKKATIKALRSFCRTDTALKSFQVFERQLYLRDSDFGGQRKATEVMRTHVETFNHLDARSVPQHDMHSPYLTKTVKSSIHYFGGTFNNALTQNLFRKSSTHLPFSGLTKSCTTSNISDIKHTCPPSHNSSAAIERDEDEKFSQINISETRIQAIRDRETRLPSRTSSSSRIIARNITTNISSMSTTTTGHRDVISTSLTQSAHGEISIISSDGDTGSTRGKEANILETERTRKASGASKSEYSNDSTRKFKKSESMKKFFDSGIREVRKISRRVSSNVGGIDDSF